MPTQLRKPGRRDPRSESDAFRARNPLARQVIRAFSMQSRLNRLIIQAIREISAREEVSFRHSGDACTYLTSAAAAAISATLFQ